MSEFDVGRAIARELRAVRFLIYKTCLVISNSDKIRVRVNFTWCWLAFIRLLV